MTGPYDDGPTGMFDHLDDAAPPPATSETLATVVHRGRRMRVRRQSAFAMTGAAAVTAAVFAGLGISHAFNAQRGRDQVITPIGSATPTASSAARSGHRHQPGDAVLVPRGAAPASVFATPPPPSPVPASPQPCEEPNPSASPTPAPSEPLIVTPPPLVPPPSPAPDCTTPPPSETPSPSETPVPSESSTPTPTPTSS